MPTELLVLVSKHSLFDVFVPEKELGAFSLLCRDHTNREQMERPVLRVSFRRIPPAHRIWKSKCYHL